MRLQTLQEAKYANPKIEQLKKFLQGGPGGGGPLTVKDGFLLKFKDSAGEATVESLSFERDEEGEFIAVTFIGDDDWHSYRHTYFFHNIEVYKTKRVF